MERSEPALVPQWLKNSGSVSSSNSTIQHSASSSSSQSDDHTTTLPTRNRSSVSSIGDYDSSRSSTFTDRTSLSYFNRNSASNGSMMHEKNPSVYGRSYSSSGRSHRDRNWDTDLLDFYSKERLVPGDHRDRYLVPSGVNANPFTNRIKKDPLRRSQSALLGQRSELRSRRVAVADVKSGSINGQSSNNSLVVGGSTNKAAFERDFPSLGTEGRQGASEIARVSSPGLVPPIQSLPTVSSINVREGWNSVLADAPVSFGSNNMGSSSVKQSAPSSPATVSPSTTTGLNMAETLAQAPSRARTTPQVAVESQRLEELAIKQSRQLIPMTPLTPKASVLNSEKPKPKVAVRSDLSLAPKVVHHPVSPSPLVNHSPRGGNSKADMQKPGQVGKLLVLKPAREKNGISPSAKDSLSPTNAVRVASNPPANPPATISPIRSSNNQKHIAEHKPSAHPAMHSSKIEKRPTTSQAQSRHDFFNLMRKKTSANSSATSDPTPVLSLNALDTGGPTTELSTVVTTQANDSSHHPCPDWSTVNGADLTGNGDACGESSCVDSQRYVDNGGEEEGADEENGEKEGPTEEELAFMRSLGWEENAGEEGGLTEEEINAFYKKYPSKPPLKFNQEILNQKLLSPIKSQVGSFDSVSSSGLVSSDSDSDA